ncbi:Na-translocating system protein MpsC family protein [Paenibacillus sp. SGZ-1009]|uniref:Na-translocating system protein MpsC family protein n=1 Tax=Paenibacillus campi TaxID=3106031 RepID=UPI002AFDEE2A|nr:Na-translocating system protein MpsC family protein [Paenibacillus sp. SGZ-1009]
MNSTIGTIGAHCSNALPVPLNPQRSIKKSNSLTYGVYKSLNAKSIITQATSYTTKLLRNRFGKGPESVSIHLCKNCVVFHLKNFISPVEKFLISQEEEQAFRYTRDLMMKSLLPELRSFLQHQLHMDVIDWYYDWGLYHASGVIVALLGPETMAAADYKHKQAIQQQIIQTTRALQKPPEYIDSWWINARMLFVFRRGTTILLEKEFITLGYEPMLRLTKDKLEKRLLQKHTGIEQIVGKKIADLYVDWNFEKDHSMIIYLFEDHVATETIRQEG